MCKHQSPANEIQAATKGAYQGQTIRLDLHDDRRKQFLCWTLWLIWPLILLAKWTTPLIWAALVTIAGALSASLVSIAAIMLIIVGAMLWLRS
jgi:hypothetical protein